MEVIPSHLRQDKFYDGNMFGNDPLRIGEVHELIQPDDPRSVSHKVIEYRVFVQHRSNGTAVSKMYDHCILINQFGGLADKLKYTLRADPAAAQDKQKVRGPGVGSKVVLLCINGESHNALIIGGIPDQADVKDDSAKGHNLHFNFNGVDVVIDKDGQMSLQVGGATTAYGKPTATAQTDKLPTTVKIEKDGKFTVATKNGKNSIVVATDGTVTVTAEKQKQARVGNNTMTIKNDGSISFNCDKSFNVTSNGPVTIKAASKCTVIANLIELGSAEIGGLPPNGVVLGSHIDTFTGVPLFALGGVSTGVFAKP